jgi:hypothetical protein
MYLQRCRKPAGLSGSRYDSTEYHLVESPMHAPVNHLDDVLRTLAAICPGSVFATLPSVLTLY